jgi:hypothetical protein
MLKYEIKVKEARLIMLKSSCNEIQIKIISQKKKL